MQRPTERNRGEWVTIRVLSGDMVGAGVCLQYPPKRKRDDHGNVVRCMDALVGVYGDRIAQEASLQFLEIDRLAQMNLQKLGANLRPRIN